MVSDADRIIGLYQLNARAWVADRGTRPSFEQAWLGRFLALIPADGRVLEHRLGRGEPIARYLTEQGGTVIGVNSSPEMIAICRARFLAQDWRVPDMRTLSLGQACDGLLAWDSFLHLCPDDQRRMFPVFSAHAAPRAALMFTSGPTCGVAIGTYQGENLYHASLDPGEYRGLLDRHGFEVEAHTVEDPACGGHTVWLARRR